ncbi:MAG: ethanolamine utilization protein EutH, partial [Clostridia bacterium]|nr:ethanolamine utilization protein EutH [Clostridia bacterium]
MNAITIIMVVFSMLAALDRIFGCRFGLGKEFERGFMLLGTMALSMIGMIVISPWIAEILAPAFDVFRNLLGIDPSVIPASLFANDMGGAPLAVEIAHDREIGMFNALVVSSMMGCTISFTIPFALGVVDKVHHQSMLLGFLCGIVTIPVGCFFGGLVCGLSLAPLLRNLLPLILFSVLIACGLFFFPMKCVKVFAVFGTGMKILITIGLALGILRYLTGIEILPGLATLEEGGLVCLNASAVMSGAFPLMYLLSRLLKKPLGKAGALIGINEISALGFVSSLATSVTTYGMFDQMDRRGIVLNAAFTISAAFTFAGHLAFTMAFDSSYVFPMIVGKLTAGVSSLLLAMIIEKKTRT